MLDLAALNSLLVTAEEGEHHLRDIGIEPWAVGAIALGALLILMAVLLLFGQGREHS